MSEPSENPNENSQPRKSAARNVADKSGIALELPFTLVGAVIVGGAIGYFLDKWLHTSPWLMVVFGGLGFFAGVREVIRRLPAGGGSGNGD